MEESKPASVTVKVEPLEASVHLVNDRMHFLGRSGERPAIDLDYVPPLGDNLGYMPLELLLMSLAACAGGSLQAMFKRMRKTVTGMDVKSSGIRRDQHPTSFKRITLEFTIKSIDITDEDVIKAIQLSEETYCPVWAMLKGSVDIISLYSIV